MTGEIVIDLNLPGADGLSIAHRLRQTHPPMGLVMLTGRTLPDDHISRQRAALLTSADQPLTRARRGPGYPQLIVVEIR